MAATATLAFGFTNLARAADSPLALLAGGAVTAPDTGLKESFAAPAFESSMFDEYMASGFHYKLTSTVMRDFAPNPYGANKLTFMYVLENLSAPTPNVDWGITKLTLSGFGNLSTSVGEGVFLSPGVVPGQTERSSGVGNEITFTYPPVPAVLPPHVEPPPPIYAGEFSNQLFIFTSAESYGVSSTSIRHAYIENRDSLSESFPETEVTPATIGTVQAFTAAVPDEASTGLLMLFGLLFAAAGTSFRVKNRA